MPGPFTQLAATLAPTPIAAISPTAPPPHGSGNPNAQVFGLGMFGPGKFGQALAADEIRNDVYNGPWKGPLDLDNYGRVTRAQMLLRREAYIREPSVKSAIDGKWQAIACLDPTFNDDANPEHTQFFKDAISGSSRGWPGLIEDVYKPALIDGWSAAEIKLKVAESGRWRGRWVVDHVRMLDTFFLRLQLDQYRNVLGIVNQVMGIQIYEPSKCVMFTHNSFYSNPFGTADLTAAIRAVNLIEDAYKMWYIALQRYSMPYMHGKISTAGNRRDMEIAMETLYQGGWIVTPKEDEVALLNLASASSFQAFEAAVNKLREDVYLAVRKTYTPFLEGTGAGGDAHHDTQTAKVTSDAGETTDAFHVAHQIQLQLGRVLMDVNYGSQVEVPELSLGGTNHGEVKQQGDILKLADELLEGQVSVQHIRKTLTAPEPESKEDSLAYLRMLAGDDKPGSIKGAAPNVLALQTAFYAGQVTQAACIANVMSTFGLDAAKAATLFPPLDPVNRVEKSQPAAPGMPPSGEPPATFSEVSGRHPTADELIASFERAA